MFARVRRPILAPLVMLALTFACTGPGRPRGPAPLPPRSSVAPAPTPPPSPPPNVVVAAAPRAPVGDACLLPVTKTERVLATAKPITFTDPHCTDKDPFCNVVERSPDPKNACFVANDNIRRAEAESRYARGVAASTSAAWDKASTPKYFDRVDGHLHLDASESRLLHRNGFVVMDRHAYASYAVAYHDVFQQQLPLYVGVDAIMNAVFQANQMLLEEIEEKRLGPRLVRILERMRATLKTAGYAKETRDDVAVYLDVAHALLHGTRDEITDPTTARLVELGEEAAAMDAVDVFGRERMIDFGQLTPRGHYAGTAYGTGIPTKGGGTIGLDRYFKAMMWLSRFEWNLVSRGSRSSEPGAVPNQEETPREARDALAVADLARRAGVLDDVKVFEDVYSVFGGRREDVAIPDLLGFGIAPNAPDAPARLKAAIGERFKRTARVHYMPEGAREPPAIATMFGPRIVPDIAPLTRLVHDRLPNRTKLDAADLGYVLGHDRAKAYLADDLATHPGLAAALDQSRAELASTTKRGDVYATWLGAVTKTAEVPAGALPSYAKTDAFADLRLASALAGYAQIRHTFVLLAGQGYDSYGCAIPDGFVEPAVGVYQALLEWSRAARTAVPHRAAYFQRFDGVVQMLLAIAKTELAGQALTEPQRRWLGMIAEYTPNGGNGGDSGEPPKYTGWYFDLFPDRHQGAERAVDLVADYFTLTNADRVQYVGVDKAMLGVFVVDVGGEPRAMVGPVAAAYEASTPIAERLNDEAARKLETKRAPWAASYVARESKRSDITSALYACGDDVRVVVDGPGDLGDVSVELLDHHGDAITPRTTAKRIGENHLVFAFEGMGKLRAEGAHVHVDDGKRSWDSPFLAGVYSYADERRRDLASEPAISMGGKLPPADAY